MSRRPAPCIGGRRAAIRHGVGLGARRCSASMSSGRARSDRPATSGSAARSTCSRRRGGARQSGARPRSIGGAADRETTGARRRLGRRSSTVGASTSSSRGAHARAAAAAARGRRRQLGGRHLARMRPLTITADAVGDRRSRRRGSARSAAPRSRLRRPAASASRRPARR